MLDPPGSPVRQASPERRFIERSRTAEAQDVGTVEGGEPDSVLRGGVENRGMAVADDGLRSGAQRIEPQAFHDPGAAVPPARQPDRLQRPIRDQPAQVLEPLLVGAGEVAVPRMQMTARNDPESSRLEVRETALERVAPDRAGRRRDADPIPAHQRRRQDRRTPGGPIHRGPPRVRRRQASNSCLTRAQVPSWDSTSSPVSASARVATRNPALPRAPPARRAKLRECRGTRGGAMATYG